MNFIRFPVAGMNIFPIANSTTGGQLVTEFNLRSRESVGTDSRVKYMIGPSYTHSKEDFWIQQQTDGAGTIISSTALEILPGRALLNGHYIESLVPVVVDIAEANRQAKIEEQMPLKGQLCVGLRAMYSTQDTIAGSLLVENKDNMFEGIQIVILPKEEFILPTHDETSQIDESKVTAHLKLGEFYYRDGTIVSGSIVQNYPARCQHIKAERIQDVDNLISDSYLRKTGLNPGKLYTFAGKGTDPNTGADTWCDSLDSLMVWDNNPTSSTIDPDVSQADFGINQGSGETVLIIPHKQVDGYTNTNGDLLYYQPRTMTLPLADFNTESEGTINAQYTKQVKAIRDAINNLYQLPAGRQRYFIDVLTDRKELPGIDDSWNIGDYILVRQDQTVTTDMTVDFGALQAPTTIYVVLPGYVGGLKFQESKTYKIDYSEDEKKEVITGDSSVPDNLTGVKLSDLILDESSNDQRPNTTDPSIYNQLLGVPSTTIRGQINVDYYLIRYNSIPEDQGDTDTNPDYPFQRTDYYYVVSENTGETVQYSSPVYVTGTIPFATTEMRGGFLNVPETYQDAGYVYLDSEGHLRVLDYALLRSGTLAYQLGQDYDLGQGLTNEEIQIQLNEYVNDRVAFPTADHQANATNPNVITITLTLSALEDDTDDINEITIQNIDSRFGTAICLVINGEATSKTTINIVNCAKIRINNNIKGTPIINIYRSCLYYDPEVINYIRQCQRDTSIYGTSFAGIQDFRLWYERYSEDEPNLLVDNMTVTEVDAPIIPEEIDYWSDEVINDNHFMYALQSITFGSDGTIIGCGIYIKNDSTANIENPGTSIIVSKFSLPQSFGLSYPTSSLTKQLKITGSFITAYPTSNPLGFTVQDVNFTALTDVYTIYQENPATEGQISFFCNTYQVSDVGGLTVQDHTNGQEYPTIDAWSSGSFSVFQGNVVG